MYNMTFDLYFYANLHDEILLLTNHNFPEKARVHVCVFSLSSYITFIPSFLINISKDNFNFDKDL